MKPIVFVDRISNDNLLQLFNKSFSHIGIIKDITEAKSIFLKPNLTYPFYKPGVTTRLEFIKTLVNAIYNINQDLKIYIGEGDGGYHSFSMSEAFLKMGYHNIEKSFPNVQIINLSKLPKKKVELRAKGKPYFIELPEIFFKEIDFSITCPVPKVHKLTKITLSFKNQYGCVPDTMRLRNHFVFNDIISQICHVLKFRYAFLDGKYGLNKNGPMTGDPIEINWFVASNSLGAFDMIVSEMMGFNWKQISHLKMANLYGFIPERHNIQVLGEMESLCKNFILNDNILDIPALAVFHSKWLTHFFYLSRFAKPLHDIMYMFRKRPI